MKRGGRVRGTAVAGAMALMAASMAALLACGRLKDDSTRKESPRPGASGPAAVDTAPAPRDHAAAPADTKPPPRTSSPAGPALSPADSAASPGVSAPAAPAASPADSSAAGDTAAANSLDRPPYPPDSSETEGEP